MGKWLGTFRIVPLLAICPTLFVFALASTDTTRWQAAMPASVRSQYNALSLSARLAGAALLPALLFAHGAATTSMGLAIASRNKRQGRAIGLSVSLFVLATVAWPILVFTVASPYNVSRQVTISGLASFSAVYAAGETVDGLLIRMDRFQYTFQWNALWAVVVSLFAAALLELTIRTFDARFGRMPERSSRDDSKPRSRKPVAEALLVGES
jgi:hypothetical protein